MATVGKIVERKGRKLYLLTPGVIARGQADSYKVDGDDGAGGFGAIYKVRRMSDNRLVVLKMSTDVRRTKNQPGGERIRREAWVMRECGKIHPDLIPCVLDEGEIGGRPFFVMENLHPLGWSSTQDGRMGLPDTDIRRKSFFMALLDSVKAVHDAGFVHCDIKPENIMERPNKHLPILIDFGSAHPLEDESVCFRKQPTGWADLTGQSGKAAFTPGYNSPEDAFTIQKDIFAIGQVIRDSFEEDVPFEWMEIIGRCISRRSKFRYGSLDELREDIENVEKRHRKRYWELRKERISEQREVERSLLDAQKRKVRRDRILHLDERLSNQERTVFRIDFPKNERVHYVVDEPLSLNENSILLISGKGILEASISGPASSVVVLSDYAVCHNTSVLLPPENDLTYVIVGPGSYLNFRHIAHEEYKDFFSSNRRRILRDIDATTSFRFCGPDTFSGIEEETLKAVSESTLPESYKKTLADFFAGKTFSVLPTE